MTGSLITN